MSSRPCSRYHTGQRPPAWGRHSGKLASGGCHLQVMIQTGCRLGCCGRIRELTLTLWLHARANLPIPIWLPSKHTATPSEAYMLICTEPVAAWPTRNSHQISWSQSDPWRRKIPCHWCECPSGCVRRRRGDLQERARGRRGFGDALVLPALRGTLRQHRFVPRVLWALTLDQPTPQARGLTRIWDLAGLGIEGQSAGNDGSDGCGECA